MEILESVTIEIECVKSQSFDESSTETDKVDEKRMDVFGEQLTAFRLALIRNLAKAIVYSH